MWWAIGIQHTGSYSDCVYYDSWGHHTQQRPKTGTKCTQIECTQTLTHIETDRQTHIYVHVFM